MTADTDNSTSRHLCKNGAAPRTTWKWSGKYRVTGAVRVRLGGLKPPRCVVEREAADLLLRELDVGNVALTLETGDLAFAKIIPLLAVHPDGVNVLEPRTRLAIAVVVDGL